MRYGAVGTLVGLHQHGKRAPDEKFSEFRVGLDHVAFGCADRGELEKWERRPSAASSWLKCPHAERSARHTSGSDPWKPTLCSG